MACDTTLDMNDMNKVAAEFLAVLPENRKARAAEALRVIFAGVNAGSILNVDYKDAKDLLNRAVDEAYEVAIQKPFCWGKGDCADTRLSHDLGLVMGLHDCLSKPKKLAKMPACEFVAANKAFFAAVVPVAKLVADLKTEVIKGRRPNPEAEARKAAKLLNVKSMDRATCGCCFKEQAVLPNGLIHDHGYSLPREWMKTASCHGRKFRPLEMSDEGPKHMVDVLTEAEAGILQNIARLKKATKLSVQRGSKRENGVRVPVMETIEVGHPEFESVRTSRIYEQESHLKLCRADLATFKKVVADWKPAEAM